MCSLVTSNFLYACESWTLTTEMQRRRRAMEMRCYRKILHISYKEHVINEQVCAMIKQAIGPHEDLTIVKRRKLKWYGHVSRSSDLAKPMLQVTVKRGRRWGRQKKRREGKIRNGQAWSSPSPRRQWKTNKEKWWKLAVKYSMVPQRPPRLRDRWRWRKAVTQEVWFR